MTRSGLAVCVRSGLLAAACLAILHPPARTAAQAGADQAVSLDERHGGATGALRMPGAPARPVAVLLVSNADTTALAAALAAGGVAALRLTAGAPSIETTARWVSFLRNDGRFPTVTVFGDGDALVTAVVAARAARADGVITRGDTGAAAAEMARLVARAGTTHESTAAGDAARIAAFARDVPVLGRRGASAARPVPARRSPRQTILTTIGSVRVAIEWGAPQKRGREIWGSLVPWDRVWMPGADEATVLTTDGAVTIGGLDVPAGDHTIYTWPSASRVDLIVSRDVGQFHTVYDESLVLGRIAMTPATRAESVEGLTFAIEGRGTSATLTLSWDTREYSAPIATK